MAGSFTLTMPSDLRMLSVARAFVEAICQTTEMDRSTIHAIVLASSEAVTNIIRHAHANCRELPVQIGCQLHEESVEIILIDEGPHFDLEAVPQLDPGELRVGGRGVFLMRALMDGLTCSPREKNGNILRMVKRWRPAVAIREIA